MAKANRMTIDEALQPMTMTCSKCSGELVVYPDEHTGIGFCSHCSPAWLGDFARFCMNEMRVKHGLTIIK